MRVLYSGWRTHAEEQVHRGADHPCAAGGRRRAKVQDVIRKMGVTETTFYRWKSKYGGLEISDAKRLKALEDENRRLKTMVADLSLDNQALKHLLGKK